MFDGHLRKKANFFPFYGCRRILVCRFKVVASMQFKDHPAKTSLKGYLSIAIQKGIPVV
jgi:hypothetical protein